MKQSTLCMAWKHVQKIPAPWAVIYQPPIELIHEVSIFKSFQTKRNNNN